jgi:hypothetical protein
VVKDLNVNQKQDLEQSVSALANNIKENEITAEVTYKKVQISLEIAKEMARITKLIELSIDSNLSESKSITFL